MSITEKEKYELEAEIGLIKSQKSNELEAIIKEKVQPLFDEATRVKQEIDTQVYNKYKEQLDVLYKKLTDKSNQLAEEKIKEAANLWHPDGTIVTLWEKQRYCSGQWKQTKKKGTVKIYDGTQLIPSNTSRWNFPKKGDVLVFLNKDNGGIGLKFVVICSGELPYWIPMWLAEGETPTNNLHKTKMLDRKNNQ